VKHKEERFLLPAWEFIILMLAEFFWVRMTNNKNWYRAYAILLKVFICFEISALFAQETYFRQMF